MFAGAARLIALLTLAGAGVGVAEPAFALEHSSLGDFLFGAPRSAAPAVARYRIDAEGGSFVLDTTPGRPAFLKFEDSTEIWALHPTPGPRGDVIYKNDMDEPMVRATRLGGVTLFTSDQPDGMPAAFISQAQPPRMPLDLGPDVLWNIFVQASARASRVAQHLVVFEGPQDVTSSTAPVFADAAILTSQAFARVGGKDRAGRSLVARFVKVEFNAGRGPDAVVKGQVVRIVVAPDRGAAGRPSSQRIANVLSRK